MIVITGDFVEYHPEPSTTLAQSWLKRLKVNLLLFSFFLSLPFSFSIFSHYLSLSPYSVPLLFLLFSFSFSVLLFSFPFPFFLASPFPCSLSSSFFCSISFFTYTSSRPSTGCTACWATTTSKRPTAKITSLNL